MSNSTQTTGQLIEQMINHGFNSPVTATSAVKNAAGEMDVATGLQVAGDGLQALDSFIQIIKQVPYIGNTGLVASLTGTIAKARGELGEDHAISDGTMADLAGGFVGILGIGSAIFLGSVPLAILGATAGTLLGAYGLTLDEDSTDIYDNLVGSTQNIFSSAGFALDGIADYLDRGLHNAITGLNNAALDMMQMFGGFGVNNQSTLSRLGQFTEDLRIANEYADREAPVPERPTSPLVFDMDGDGIETVAMTSTYFDHNNDGRANLTGWIAADDAFLVYDKNQDGLISNGNELFGDNYIKADGSRASDGFDALRELDSNGDGLFNSSDAAYSTLKIWQDVNQDGISQAEEMRGLEEAGISSINLNAADVDIDTGDGNKVILDSTFTWTDGTNGQIVDVVFEESQVYTRSVDTVDIPPDILDLPNLPSMGYAKSWHESMLSNPELRNLIEQLADSTSAGMQKHLVNEILLEWTGAKNGEVFWSVQEYDWSRVGPDQEWELLIHVNQYKVPGSEKLLALAKLSGEPNDLVHSGLNFIWHQYVNQAVGRFTNSYEVFLNETYEIIVQQTRLQDYFSLVDVNFQAGDLEYDYTKVENLIRQRMTNGYDAYTLTEDLVFLAKNHASYFNSVDFSVLPLISEFLSTITVTPHIRSLLATANLPLEEYDSGLTGGESIVIGTSLNDFLLGDATDTEIYAEGGDDTVIAGAATTLIDGGDGNDTLNLSGQINTSVFGGNGEDTITVEQYNGTNASTVINQISGGKGNDVLNGSLSQDHYIFNRGDGQDTINNYFGRDGNDRIVFGSGILASDLQISNDGDSIVITLLNSDGSLSLDSIILQNAFISIDFKLAGGLIFADGSEMTWEELKSASAAVYGTDLGDSLSGTMSEDVIYGEGGDDSINGNAGDDYLYGGTGNDSLNGGTGNDVLWGGDGNDTITDTHGDGFLYGESGNDLLTVGAFTNSTLDGGQGNDVLTVEANSHVAAQDYVHTLIGGEGNDTLNGSASQEIYLFNRGDGQDTITNYLGRHAADKIVFGNDINASDLQFTNNGSDIIIKLLNSDGSPGADSILLKNAFDNPDFQLAGGIFFADGSPLTWEELKGAASAIYGTDSAETLNGSNSEDVIYGQGGDDSINGNAGDDQLYGGAGNDNLDGGSGNDHIRGGEGNDILIGNHGDDLLYGESGNDEITVSTFTNSTLDGGIGDDILTVTANAHVAAQNYVHTLIGGEGNDILNGSASLEIYLFSRGDGQDTITNHLGRHAEDRIVFGSDINTSDLEISNDGTSIIITLLNSDGGAETDSITLQNAFNNPDFRLAGGLSFADGSIMTWEQLKIAASAVYGTDSAETLNGSNSEDVIYGQGGDDAINGNAGDDQLYGGAGNDNLDGGSGNDQIRGGEGNDVLIGNHGDDVLYGESGNDEITVSTFTNSTLDGGSGDDVLTITANSHAAAQGYVHTLIGGEGNDTLNGSASQEIYVFNRGDGQDTITNYLGRHAQDRIVFGSGISLSDLQISNDGTNIIIAVPNNDGNQGIDSIILQNSFASDDFKLAGGLSFADGSVMTWLELFDSASTQNFNKDMPEAESSDSNVFIESDGMVHDESEFAIDCYQNNAAHIQLERLKLAMASYAAPDESFDITTDSIRLDNVVSREEAFTMERF